MATLIDVSGGNLSKGSKGPAVVALQQFLIDQGYDLGSFGADGDFGPITLAAVRLFQKDQGLTVDGVVGPKTVAAVDAVVAAPGGAGTDQPAPGTDSGGTILATIATNKDNYEQVRQQYLEATGFFAYVGADFKLHFVASPESLAALKAVGAFTIYTQPGGTLPPLVDDVQQPGGEQDPATGRIEDPEEPVERGEGEPIGVMGGGILVQIRRVGQEDAYIQMFEFPPGSGRFIAWQYDSFEQALDIIGPNARVERIIEESMLDAEVNIVGGASEIQGIPGTFTGFIDDVIRKAAATAGIADPSILGQMMADPEIQSILVLAALGEWSAEQMQAALRDTDFWTKTLYPGIRNLYGISTNPEADYKRYVENVTGALDQLGIPRELQKQKIAALLAAGVVDTDFLAFVPSYAKAVGNPQFKIALESRLRAAGQLGPDEFLDFGTFIDALEGTAPAEIQNVVDEANLEFIAAIQNVGFELGDALGDISAAIDVDEGRARNIIDSTSMALLALGTQGLRRANLTTDDILRGAAGLGSGTMSNIDLQSKIRKFAIEEGLMDDRKSQFFLGFDEGGRPQRQGLAAAAPELG